MSAYRRKRVGVNLTEKNIRHCGRPKPQGRTVLMTTVYVLLPVQPSESVAVTVKVNTPVVVGVPESTPPDCKIRPGGNEPAELVKL